MMVKLVFVLLLTINYCLGDVRPIVKLNLGTVRGVHKESYNGRIFSAFEGIPYAKPPVGKLRFEKPHEIDGWNGIWDANTKHECIQYLDWAEENVYGDEDCLYVNVYVPRKVSKPGEDLDVIVHIHGGAFMMGSSHSYIRPTFLMDRDVIFVTFNYRLGMFGFLSTEDEVVPGNNGLKDQNLALKWIKNNIHNFGGNPKSITLTGFSAGSASVHYQYLSSQSKGLFQRAIIHSAVAINPWALQEEPLEKAKKLATSLGCTQSSTKEFVKCMKQRPAKKIVENTKLFYEYLLMPFSPFAPVIEKPAEDAFITKHPYELLRNGDMNDVPLIASITTEEGIFPVLYFFEKLKEVDENWEKLCHILLESTYTVSKKQKKDVAQKIRQFYFGDKKFSKENLNIMIKLFSDRHFLIGSEEAIRMHVQVAKSTVYYYIFGYKGSRGLYELISINTTDYGVSHGDDVIFLYDTFGESKLSPSDEKMKEIFLNMYTSFAKNSKPEVEDVKWEPVSEELVYLNINNPKEITMEKAEELAPTEFWKSLPINENEKLFPLKDEL